MTTSLRELQASFWQHMLGDPACTPAPTLFYAENGFGAEDRVNIYADMYSSRLLEALQIDYTPVRAWLGDAHFASLAQAYVRKHPPRHFSITYLGEDLAQFLAREGLPIASDLAALAWARSQVMTDADGPKASLAALGGYANPESVCLIFAPAMRVLDVTHDVARTWRALEDTSEPSNLSESEPSDLQPPHAPKTLAVWRSQGVVLHTTLQATEARALAAARAGEPLGRICEAFAHLAHPEDEALRAIAAWFADGWVCAVRA